MIRKITRRQVRIPRPVPILDRDVDIDIAVIVAAGEDPRFSGGIKWRRGIGEGNEQGAAIGPLFDWTAQKGRSSSSMSTGSIDPDCRC